VGRSAEPQRRGDRHARDDQRQLDADRRLPQQSDGRRERDVDNTTVHELRLVDEDHALSESIYLVFEYDQTTGQWTTLTAHESYNGSADYEHRFSGFLATNTADETDRFVTEYVADGEPIASDRAYNAGVLSRYAGPFGSDAESTLLDDGFDGFEDGADS